MLLLLVTACTDDDQAQSDAPAERPGSKQAVEFCTSYLPIHSQYLMGNINEGLAGIWKLLLDLRSEHPDAAVASLAGLDRRPLDPDIAIQVASECSSLLPATGP